MSELALKARAVADAVFSALLMAEREPERESYWRAHADKLETKFKTEHGRHYAGLVQYRIPQGIGQA